MSSFLLAAVHTGPYLSVQPLEVALTPLKYTFLVDGVSKMKRERQDLPYMDMEEIKMRWGNLERFMDKAGITAVIRSTSENVTDIDVENLASSSAGRLGIPVFVVEDFTGNYRSTTEQRLDGLFVEDRYTAEIHSARGIDPGAVFATGNPRYSGLKDLDSKYRSQHTRADLGLTDEPVMLWAGQQDDRNSFLALERILGRCRALKATLLFRAHPRDPLYVSGEYRSLIDSNGLRTIDVTSYPDNWGLYCAADLLVTQFSSAGVEASHLGTPALFVLFDDIGKQYLREHKGYETLPWCDGSSSYLVEHEDNLLDVINDALFNSESRSEVVNSFQSQFGVGEDCPKKVVGHIVDLLGATG